MVKGKKKKEIIWHCLLYASYLQLKSITIRIQRVKDRERRGGTSKEQKEY